MCQTPRNVRWVAAVLCMWPAGCMRPAEQARPGALPRAPLNHGPVRIRPTTYFAHGHLLEREGRFEEAVEQYKKALRLKPDFVAARNRLGITLNKLGRHREATDQFLRAVELRPEEAYLHNNLGFSLYLEGDYTEALAELEKALQLTPDFARARMNYALVLARLGRYDDAFTQLTQVGDEADACFNMGMLLSDAGKYAEAARYLERAVELRPTFAAARIQLREVARIVAAQEAHAADGRQPATAHIQPQAEAGPTQTQSASLADASSAGPDGAPVAPPAATFAPGHGQAADEDAGASRTDVSQQNGGVAVSQPGRRTVVAGVSFERAPTADPSETQNPQADAGSPTAGQAAVPADTGDVPSDPVLEQMLWELTQTPEVVGDLLDELASFTSLDDPEAQDIFCTLSYLLFPETAPEDFLGLPPR